MLEELMNWLSERTQHTYGLAEIQQFLAEAYPDDHHYLAAEDRNAIAHALASALLTMRFSELDAEAVGDAREFNTTFEYYHGTGEDERAGTFLDLYNNQVGRTIGRYGIENALSEAEVQRLVEEAWRSGQLAVWTTYTDIPVPPIIHDPNGYLTGGALFQLLLSHDEYGGWPHQYHPVDNIWSPTPHPVPDYTPVWTVREVQAALSRAGEAVKVDGAWGPNSRNGLTHYQQMSGLPVTGIPDAATIDSLMASGHWLMPDYLVRSESLADQYLQWKAEQHSPADLVGAAAILSQDALIDAGQATWVQADDVNPPSYLRRPTSAPVAESPSLPVMPYGVMTATHFPIGWSNMLMARPI